MCNPRVTVVTTNPQPRITIGRILSLRRDNYTTTVKSNVVEDFKLHRLNKMMKYHNGIKPAQYQNLKINPTSQNVPVVTIF